MAGENIRFGLSDYGNSKGFKIRTFKNFAERIDIWEIYEQMGGEEKMSLKTKTTINNIFFKIAGADGSIDRNELVQYFRALDRAAAEGDLVELDKDTLDRAELYNMEAKRGNVKEQETFLGIPVNIDKETRETLGEFIKALVNLNDEKVAKEQVDKVDLESRTTYNKDGSRTVKEYDFKSKYSGENQTQRTTTYDKDNKVLQKTFVDSNNRKHTELYKDGYKTKEIIEDKEEKWTTTFDKDGNEIKREIINKKSGEINTFYTTYKDGKRVREESASSDGYKSTTIISYNKQGQIAKETETNYKNGKLIRTSTRLYKNEHLSKEIEKSADNEGTVERFYSTKNEFEPYKEVHKDKNGNIQYSIENTYQEGNPNPVKQVTKNAAGEVQETVLYQYNKNDFSIMIREEHQDASGKTRNVVEYNPKKAWERTKATEYGPMGEVTTTTYKNGNESKVEVKDANGNVVETKEFSYNANGQETKCVKKDGNGNITQCTETFYDAQGRTAKTVKKDGNGAVVETISDTYPAKGVERSEFRNSDGMITFATTTKRTNNTSVYTDESFKNGKLVCVREHTIEGDSDKVIYRNGHGEEITFEEYKSLKKQYSER